ncbi:MAG: filamentous hemagglutinin N-terminal domain-containing protein, partial [Coleofasciculus sp. S288]|nr:filamentous hemagglutinin N-terminal domain-containing protein [Coleofasciculus sp. S288]
MTQIQVYRRCQLGVVSVLAMSGAIVGNCAFAQNITLDGSLGPAGTLTGPDYFIPQAVGQRVGSNLFHSFGQFNLDTDEAAIFQSAPIIRTILSRVTGGSPSFIDGLILTTSSNVNLFLMNPSGIVFGPNASLDVGSATRGSFVATTANAIAFGPAGAFEASPSQRDVALLTVDPSAFLFNQMAAQPIVNQAGFAGLQVPPGQSLLLVGGDVRLEGGRMRTPGGRIELGGVAGTGTVGLSIDGNDLHLSFPDGVEQADVSLTNGAGLITRGPSGGDVQIFGKRVAIANESAIIADTVGNQNAGGIFIRAEELNLESSSFLSALTSGSGKGGDITFETAKLLIEGGTQIGTGTTSSGGAGNLTVIASDSVEVRGTSADGTVSGLFTLMRGTGDPGDLTIQTRQLVVQDGARIDVSAFGEAQPGNLTVTASDSIELIGTSPIDDRNQSGLFLLNRGVGTSGNLTVQTGRLIARDGAAIVVAASGEAQTGDLTVTASDSVELMGTSPLNERNNSGLFLLNGGVGTPGELTVQTRRLIAQGGARVEASASNAAQIGNLTITASDSVELRGTSETIGFASGLFARSLGTGDAGDLRIETERLIIEGGARASASTNGGQGGRLIVNASESVELTGTAEGDNIDRGPFTGQFGSGLFTQTVGEGNAGELIIDTKRLIVRDGAEVSASTLGQGAGGTLRVNASESVEVFGRAADDDNAVSRIFAGTAGEGVAGNLQIVTGELSVQDGAQVTVSSQGTGKAGDLVVEANSIRLNNKGELIAQTQSGDGGNITLQARDFLLMRNGSNISTTAGLEGTGGDGGDIDINAKLIIAVPVENSDIRANAFEGRGGNIQISTQGLFGIQFRP